MKNLLIIFFAMIAFNLLSVPIITNVNITQPDSIIIKYNILNFEQGIRIELGCFKEQSEIEIDTAQIKGDIFMVKAKKHYRISINKSAFPPNFNLEKYRVLPKILYNGRICYEMQKVNSGSYPIKMEDNMIEMIDIHKFYISKFEITNEQFNAFVNADGYEFQEYWEVAPDLMSKDDIGWYYLAKFKMSLPLGWNFKNVPYYQKAESNFKYGALTNVRWFEVYAFANWMNCELPTFDQMCVAFSQSESSSKLIYSGITEFSNDTFPLQKIHDGVAEWLESGVEPTAMSCAGCNEMYFVENSTEYPQKAISYAVKCPLFRAPFLGARIVVNTNKSKIK